MRALASRLLASPYVVWALLALPGVPYLAYLLVSPTWNLRRLTSDLGEWSAYFLIATLCVTPLMLLFRGQGWTRWLFRNRRYIGVAAFGFAAAHTVAYLAWRWTWEGIVGDLLFIYILSGWAAFLLMLPPAATSMDLAVRRLGTRWKTVQQLVYPVAVLTWVHWAGTYEWRQWGKALWHFAPLILLTLIRLWLVRQRRQRRAAGN
jgi:sulfoxide reductase heme-binding subunit YedZ